MLHRRPTHARLGLLEIIAAAVLWGAGGVVVRLLHDGSGLDPIAVAFYRLLTAAAVLLPFALLRRRPTAPAPRLVLVAAGVGLAGYQALYFVAVTAVGVAVATVVSLGVAPLLLTAWEAAADRRRPSAGTLATLGAALAGLALVASSGAEASSVAPRPVLGLLCALGSGAVYAATSLLVRRAAGSVPALRITTVSSCVGAVALAPFGAAAGLAVPLSPEPLLLLVFLGPVTTALAYALFYRGLRTTTAGRAAVVTLVEPVAAALLAVAVLGDPLPATTLAGGVLILGAVAALHRAPVTTAAAPRARRSWRGAGRRYRARGRRTGPA